MTVEQAKKVLEMTKEKFNGDVYPFKKSDGFVLPCLKGCPNCTHCTDVYWDYINGIYDTECNINGKAPRCEHYENDGTKPVTREEFNKMKEKENEMINKIGFEKAAAIILMGGTLEEQK